MNPYSKFDHRLLKIVQWCIYATLVGVPIFLLKFGPLSVNFPYTFPKAILFQGLVQIMFAAWIVLAYRNPEFRPNWRHSITIGALVFFSLTLISQFFSNNFHISFWGSQSRMLGMFHYAHILAWFLVLHSTFKTRDDWRRFLTLISWTAAIVSAVGIIEWFAGGFRQIESTLGNAVFLASYLLLAVFLTIWRYQESGAKIEKRIFGVLLAFILIALFFTGSRSAILGLIAGLAVWAIFNFTHRNTETEKKRNTRRRAVWIVLCAGILILLVALSQTSSFGHLFSSKIGDRIALWEIGLDAWKERPLFGWGFDQFEVPFNRLRDPNKYFAVTDLWHDRAHNVFIDTMAASGLVGLFGYLLLWGLVVFSFWKSKDKPPHIIAFFAVYLTNIFFQPEQLLGNILLFFVFAGMVGNARRASASGGGRRLWSVVLPVLIFILPLLYFTILRPLSADMSNLAAMRLVQKDTAQGLEKLQSVFSENHLYERDMLTRAAGIIFDRAPSLIAAKDEVSHALLRFTKDELDASLEKNPDYLRTAIAAVWIEQALIGYEPEALERLGERARYAMNLAPYFAEPYEALGAQAVFSDDLETALVWYEQAEKYTRTNFRKTQLARQKAEVYSKLGRWPEAIREVNKLSELGQSLDARFLINASLAAEAHSELPEEMLGIAVQFVNAFPKDVRILEAAAILFHFSGRHEVRDKILGQIERLLPESARDLRERLSI